MEFASSDLHFFHKKILQFQPESRRFQDVDEMNEVIVKRHNSVVPPDGITYILGDVTFGPVSKTVDLLKRLNGKLILVAGNHDAHALKKAAFRECFDDIHQYLEINIDKRLLVMFHYPIESWNNKHHDSIHLHGHLHSINQLPLASKRWDVGLDSNNCTPYNIRELIKTIDENYNGINSDHHGRIL